jgi:hypothetical protein
VLLASQTLTHYISPLTPNPDKPIGAKPKSW